MMFEMIGSGTKDTSRRDPVAAFFGAPHQPDGIPAVHQARRGSSDEYPAGPGRPFDTIQPPKKDIPADGIGCARPRIPSGAIAMATRAQSHTGPSESPLSRAIARGATRSFQGGTSGTRSSHLVPDALRLLLPILTLLLVAGRLAGAELSGNEPSKPWSLAPLKRPEIPGPRPGSAGATGRAASHPIDAFIGHALAAKQWPRSPQADRRTLARRIYFDLIGLPPTPEQLQEFLNDPAPDAYERLVDRLLASPRHGERWARHWIDAVHFAETHGHDQDRIRENAWPYRDYLIASFNADKPYARLVEEQVAGDVLFPDVPDATVALGFLAAGPWDESSLRDIREDSIDREIGRYLDRDDMVTTVMQTFTSTTVQCARCHDHKFDPISQRDYYALQASLAGVERANRAYDREATAARQRRELKTQLAAVQRGDRQLLLSAATRNTALLWEQDYGAAASAWHPLSPESIVSAAGAMFNRQDDGSFLVSGMHGPKDTYTVVAKSPLPRITAVRLEVLPDDSLPQRGPGREPNGNLHLSEFELHVRSPGETAPQRLALREPVADFNQEGWTIRHALDGQEKTAWGIFPQVGKAHQATFTLDEPLAAGEGTELTLILRQLHGGHCIGRLRLAVTETEPSIARTALAPLTEPVRQVLATPAANRTDAHWTELGAFVLRQNLERALSALPKPALVYAAAHDFEPDGQHKPAGRPRTVRVLNRGDIFKPGDEASPGALSCVAGLPARFALADPMDEGSRRAALARWLTHPENPLTWRSIVNRVWHHHFGRGLVDTPNDFGRMGSTPSHPELLDWLAVWFRDDAQGSLKQLHRLIVTSATYRQASTVSRAGGWGTGRRAGSSPQLLDAENRWLTRMNRTRLDAEQIRDAVLQISGRLDLRMGGPSDRLFELRPGVHVTPVVDYHKFAPDSDAGRRRSIYRFLFRTLPDPFMDALDCPAGDQLTPARSASVTVQQALALWNNAFIARQVEHLAKRLEQEPGELEDRVGRAFELILGRPPTKSERREFVTYARQHGLANLGRVLFNSNEFMFVN